MSNGSRERSVAGETEATMTVNEKEKNVVITFALPDGIKPEEVSDLVNLSLGSHPVNFVKIELKS